MRFTDRYKAQRVSDECLRRVIGGMSGLFASVWLTVSAAAVPDALFDQYQIETGELRDSTVLSGFFLSNTTAELAVAGVNAGGEQQLILYAFSDDKWSPVLRQALRSNIVLLDAGRVGNRDVLITYDNRRVGYIDLEVGTERFLLDIKGRYRRADDGPAMASVDIVRDLNDDGRDDIVVPDPEGFWISTQDSDGKFAPPQKYGPAEPFLDRRPVDDGRNYRAIGITARTWPWYLSRIHRMDFDLDGDTDLAFWSVDHFDIYRQAESGRFETSPVVLDPDPVFENDGVYSLMFGFEDENALALLSGLRRKSTRTLLHRVQDLNGDRIADLVILTLTGRSMLRQRSTFEFHYGHATEDGVRFHAASDITITPKGKAGLMQASGYASQVFDDIDSDGDTDILFIDVAVGVSGMARAMVGNSVPINIEIYPAVDKEYSKRSSVRRKVRRFAPFAGFGNVFFPPVLLGDVTGDGRSDLVVGHSPGELRVYAGQTGPALLARRPQKIDVPLPYDERNVRLVDLNNDNRQDVLVKLGPTGHAPNTASQLVILIAR